MFIGGSGRPRRIGAMASKTFSRACTPAFFDGEVDSGEDRDLNITRSSTGFIGVAPGTAMFEDIGWRGEPTIARGDIGGCLGGML